MERPRFIESQLEKLKEAEKCRDNQFHNLYKEMLKNRKDIEKCAKLISELAEVIKTKEK